MAVKAILDSLDGLPDALKGEYEQGEGGKFYLKVDGFEDGCAHPAVGALVRAKKREADARAKAETAAKEAREKLEAKETEMEQRLEGALPKSDVEALRKSYSDKAAARETELTGQITVRDNALKSVLVDSVALGLATRLAMEGSAPVLLPHILPRLSVEIGSDGKAVTRVLDKEGKPSAATLADLEKEIVGTAMFAGVLIGSKATGGGAKGGNGGGGAPPKTDLTTATQQERAAYAKSKIDTGG